MKTVAGRPQDIFDLQSIVTRQNRLDWSYIFDYLAHVQEYEDIATKVAELEELKSKFYRP